MPTQGILTGANNSLDYWPTLAANALSCQRLGVSLTVADHGLSSAKRSWLAKRGANFLPGHPKYEFPESRGQANGHFGNHQAWWKPLICLASPYDHTIWIDADAILLRDPSSAFSLLATTPWITRNTPFRPASKEPRDGKLVRTMLVPSRREWNAFSSGPCQVNSGVFGFRHSDEWIEEWVGACRDILSDDSLSSKCHLRDQTALIVALCRRVRMGRLTPEWMPDSWNYPANGLTSRNTRKRKRYSLVPDNLLPAVAYDHRDVDVVHWLGKYKVARFAPARKRVSVPGDCSSAVNHPLRPPVLPRPQYLPGELAVIGVYFNPAGFRRRLDNAIRSVLSWTIQGCRVHLAELSYDDQFELTKELSAHGAQVEEIYRLRGRYPRHILWQKERMINLVVERLPERYDKVAWLDLDLLYHDSDWHHHLASALQVWPVVQPFRRVHLLPRSGTLDNSNCSSPVGVAWRYLQVPRQYGLLEAPPGFAWAARRELLATQNLFDLCLSGSGDCVWVAAIYDWQNYDELASGTSHPLHNEIVRWHNRIHAKVACSVGALPHDVSHQWHGMSKDRGYGERHRFLKTIELEKKGITVSSNGLYAWQDPNVGQQMETYFRQRREDG